MPQFWADNIEEIFQELETDKNGLSKKEAESRLLKFGKNKLPEEKPIPQIKLFFTQFQSPLIYILVIAGLVTLILKDYTDTIVIFAAVLLNTIVGFVQENKASRALQALKKVLKIKAIVLRNGNEKEILQQDVVPGDIILLKAGDKIPADARLIEDEDLKVNESSLTGEWLPARKHTKTLKVETPLADRDNMVFMGTIVESGFGKAVVTAIGLKTEIGKVAQMLKKTKEEKTPYQKKLARFSKIVGIIIGILAFLIFIEGMITGEKFVDMFITSIAVAVAAIPEGLPVAMTVILALGMQRILKKKGLVRRLVSAETLGSVSVICADKTGTLTEGKMSVAGVYCQSGKLESNSNGHLTEIDGDDKMAPGLALKIATLRSEAIIENPKYEIKNWLLRGRPTDKALTLAGAEAGFLKEKIEKKEPKIGEIPFSPVYKFSASLHKSSRNQNILYVLGAPELILKKSQYIEVNGKMEKLSQEKLTELNLKLQKLATKGLRLVAAAYKKTNDQKLTTKLKDTEQQSVLSNLVFVGFIGLADPLRKEAKDAIKLCREAGIRPVIITGDHKLTAKAVAQQLGMAVEEKNIIQGDELAKLTKPELKDRVRDIEIYARVEPAQKLKIVEALQEKGQVVAMTGDGINDAPALKKADVGVALGSGTQVAKEVSDLVLLDNNFNVIVLAIEEGRAILDNIRKVITYLLSDSFTEVILIGVSLLFGWPLPILAAQILWVNLIEDGLPNIALAFEPKEKDLMKQKPQGHEVPLLTREMKTLIFIIGIFTDLLLLGLFFWLLKYSGYEIAHIRSIIFAGLAIDSLFYVFSCKSLRKNIWQINPFSNKFLVYSWIVGFVALVAALYIPTFQMLLKTQALNLFDWSLLLVLGIFNLLLIEATKWFFIARKEK